MKSTLNKAELTRLKAWLAQEVAHADDLSTYHADKGNLSWQHFHNGQISALNSVLNTIANIESASLYATKEGK